MAGISPVDGPWTVFSSAVFGWAGAAGIGGGAGWGQLAELRRRVLLLEEPARRREPAGSGRWTGEMGEDTASSLYAGFL